ncbi:MAG: UvrD-helicase domain-containing protein [Oscillospiraceae bacterium]|nr:UvrD-helicase domain-containing protein [Oscillospiraceae bacterium]
MIIWSEEQLAAINYSTAENGSAIVSAAAGSGKTAMLVERIMRMITNEELEISADKISAVTFTNDAAEELKSRLQSEINRLKKDSKNEWLNKQLIRLESAFICTIHSFCLRILREFSEHVGLKPDFKICDENEGKIYSKKALNFALEKIYDAKYFTEKEKMSLQNLTGEAGDSKIGNAILELYDEYTKQPFPNEWLDEKIALFDDPKKFKSEIAKDAEIEIKNMAEICLASIEECFDYTYSESMTERLFADKRFAESWINSTKGLLEHGNSNYGNVSEKHKESKKIIKEIRDNYLIKFKEIKTTAGLLFDFDIVVKKQAFAVKTLVKLFKIYVEEFTRLKKEANRVDFSDAEHYCLNILQNDEIKNKINSYFYEIIVDEFQDSNAVQYEIFRNAGSENLFLVGDVKQSIYRFRNADPSVFVSVLRDNKFVKLTLNKNFRSSNETIIAINNIFEKNMSEKVGNVNYNDDVKLIFGADKFYGIDLVKPRSAEIFLIKSDTEEKKMEADFIAERINKMIENGFLISEKNGEKRRCNYGDFAVLVSGLSTVDEEFSTAFEKRAIPYDKQKSGDYSEVPEIKIIIALLTIIERPFEDMELLKVLMSPLYNFTADDISKARVNALNKPLFDNLESYIKPDKNTATYQKTRAFLDDFYRWNSYSKNFGGCKLIRQIYNEGGFNPLAARSRTPEKTMFDIRLLLHYSENLKGVTRDSLSDLIKFLDGKMSGKLEESRHSNEGEKRVKLMTIHASKGLEFPICFVARTAAKFNISENYSDIIINSEVGFGLRYIMPEIGVRCDTLHHTKAKEINKKAALSEEMRKLYVACTRARDKLILTGVIHNDKVPEDSFLHWLSNSEVEKIHVNTSEISQENQHQNDSKTTEKTAKNISNEAQKQAILDAVKKTYHREELTKIPRRVTATQVFLQNAETGTNTDFTLNSTLEENQDEPTIFPRTPSFMGTGKLTGKKRGDAYHKMMELIEFSASDITAEVDKNKSRFTEEEFAVIELEKILAFFDSPLGKRAAASEIIQKEYKLCTEITLSDLGFSAELDKKYDEKPLVQGIADMFFYEGEKIILVDYKTNRNTTREKLKELYKGQLDIYARAIEEMTGFEVREKWIYSFELGEILT